MTDAPNSWTLLVYKIPSQPTRFRLQIWRKLQRMGALYLQDAVCIVPSRPDLDENMQYIAESIAEMGGTYYLFKASTFFPEGAGRLADGFRDQADASFDEIARRVEKAQATLGEVAGFTALEAAEEELKRERVAFLRARRLAYFGSDREPEVEERLDALRRSLDDLHRNGK
jgi:DNA-binding transcriptional regulator PaaX